MMEDALQDYARLYDLPEPRRPIKYPRDLDSICKPHPDDNSHNAWYNATIQCRIQSLKGQSVAYMIHVHLHMQTW